MKTTLMTLVLLCLTFGVSRAQSNVTITQHGHSNQAVVIQGADSLPSGFLERRPCYKKKQTAADDKNIIILKSGGGQQVFKVTGRQANKLSLFQQGDSAKAATEVWANIDSVAAVQHGKANKMVLTLRQSSDSDRDGRDYDLTQTGGSNFIYVGPCGKASPESIDNGNSVKIKQQGEGNTVIIQQG